ncbi:MAG: permease-like cell division protein FtsX [Actinomycetota bacterium]
MARLEYLFRETTIALRRNGLVAFAAISTTFIALLLFGLALLISRQVNLMIAATTGNVEVAVYLADPVNDQTTSAIQDRLESLDIVSTVEYESKQDACDRFRELFRGQSALVNNVDCDALPASLRVKLSEPEKFAQVTAILGCERQAVEGGGTELVCAQPGIENVVDNSNFLKRLFAVTRVFRVGVLLVSIVMLLSAAILIANTVRMGLFARRKEIGIMKLVGATNWRIRLPFLVEGLVESLIGAGAAVLFLFGLKVAFINPLYGSVRFIPWVTNADVLAIVPWLLVAGALLAIVASLAGMRRFLDV